MNEYEQMMCELQAEFFELSVERFKCGSAFFISRYMNSEIAKKLDKTNDPYNYISPNTLITTMATLYRSLNDSEGEKYPKKVMHWIGYIYRAYTLMSKNTSSNIYKAIKAEKMLSLYETYHTFSPEYCVERLKELVNENAIVLDDYEIYKQIREQN